MKNFIPMLVLMLAVSLSALAQSTPDAGQSSPTAGQTSDKTTSITGCISESNGKYMITDKSHPGGLQLVSSDDLKPHVGHKVRVSGTMDNAGSTQASGSQAGDMSSMVLKVSDMKMISEHCDTPK
jgi:hypothetical protein